MREATPPETDPFREWFAALEARHLRDLTFAEVRRALQALSSLYVERRRRLPTGAALDGAGKRAAFALFYGPLHFLLVREIIRSLGAARRSPGRLVDLGCGTGASGAAWALECEPRPSVTGLDRNPWALEETRRTLGALQLRGKVRRADVARARFRGRGESILAAFTLNEVSQEARELLLPRFLEAALRGADLLVVEPLSRGATPWWEEWSAAFQAAGGRSDLWKFPAELPDRLRLLARAAGLDHRELKGKSLWLPGSSPGAPGK
ncbi:MAG: methyltransferase domain-containing protein [Gemmatimonadales bacterium]|nr:MAG: methyltransferase domain-containing protein [Gemmatimonadales bacterium]